VSPPPQENKTFSFYPSLLPSPVAARLPRVMGSDNFFSLVFDTFPLFSPLTPPFPRPQFVCHDPPNCLQWSPPYTNGEPPCSLFPFLLILQTGGAPPDPVEWRVYKIKRFNSLPLSPVHLSPGIVVLLPTTNPSLLSRRSLRCKLPPGLLAPSRFSPPSPSFVIRFGRFCFSSMNSLSSLRSEGFRTPWDHLSLSGISYLPCLFFSTCRSIS